jgi:hypothetical protein
MVLLSIPCFQTLENVSIWFSHVETACMIATGNLRFLWCVLSEQVCQLNDGLTVPGGLSHVPDTQTLLRV